MNYEQALTYIHDTYKFGRKLGLDNIKYLLNLLDNPHQKVKVIHVAGTNGKGSIASLIHSVLKTQGYRVGLYTSPYLEEFTERIRISGEDIPRERLAQVTEEVKMKIEEMVKSGQNHPTEFEVVTAIAFLYYAQEEVDFVVLEVGLGGRLDATNVINTPLLSIITPIGYDHTAYLGNTLKEIAFEKGGVIKEDGLTLVAPQEEEALQVLKKLSQERNNQLFMTNLQGLEIKKSTIEEQVFSCETYARAYENVEIKLLGAHQIENCCTALTAIDILKEHHDIEVSDESIYQGILETRWPGRMEVVQDEPTVIIDGAHNLQGGQALANTLKQLLSGRRITFVMGMLEDKEVDGFLNELIPLVDIVIATTPNSPRSMPANVLAGKMDVFKKPIHVEAEVRKAIEKGLALTGKDDVLLFAGSLYMIGEVRSYFKSNQMKTILNF
ncbi:FolC bifunctional protein [Alkaliphilus metalliredigens QYMF]|uniref:tetrahydrofolate synthase n=1 Tax=Alkaliphilus metalliredigens (strain QYMF) TaxID=293826 RepID=A6TN35_ALKMQ|nr:folylpolyglutamate synthase/dihydrofolate synthase family protein [Alkaliphilus metalliredigens]ABR47603.1 FolC bifunctional protein [Alkaliphilus metalliredigens QYMF]